jgi:uroporphyrin-III C-methyltransferase/precorrin-2 dehydrogenase/sirohydrochlorin ferrochelatase
MRQFMISYPLEGKRIVIVGGGEAARRKARLLASSPARLEVFAPAIDVGLAEELKDRVIFHLRDPNVADLRGAALAIVAEESLARATQVAGVAREAGVPVNVVDRPELCDWHTPALIDRGAVTIGVATGGASPVIARDLRARIELAIPKGVGLMAEAAKALRARVARALPNLDRRRAFWERALRGPAARRADDGDAAGVRAAMLAALEAPDRPHGVVHIVGAGPGDPDLLTLKAARLLQDADVILHDALVAPACAQPAKRTSTPS